MPTLEQLKARKALLEARITKTKVKQAMAHRRADLHLKAALGGGVLIALANSQLPHTFKAYLLKVADGGVQKQGLARVRFEELKARHVPSPLVAANPI
jgi:hypothetical protein